MSKLPARKKNRLKGYDYSRPGYYFTTICVERRQQIFGAVLNNKMILNDVGKMVDSALNEIPKNYPGIFVDRHIVMPNHVHVIINIVGAGSPRPKSNCPDNNVIGRGNRAPTIGNIIAYFKYLSSIRKCNA